MGAKINRRELSMMLIIYICAFILYIAFALISTIALVIGIEALIDSPVNKKAWILTGAGCIGLTMYISLGFYVASDIPWETSFNNT